MRTKRTNGSNTYNYTYYGSQLTHMTYGSNVLHFYYDASGKPLSVVYNGVTYYYVLNLQGDVVALLDSTGDMAVEYRYDAWGRLRDVSGDMEFTLGLHNPLRYRGYVYDRETELYYLQSRYYNPEIGRFINADSLVSTGQGILGCNMFAYCNNDPVNEYDPSGCFAISAIIIGAIIGFATAAYIDYQDDGEIFNGSVKGYDYLGATVLGGALGVGGVAFAGMSFSATFPTGFAIVQTTIGTSAVVSTGAVTLTVTGTQVMEVAGLIGSVYLFAKGGLPSNKHQNQQWAEAMRQLGIGNKDLQQRLHHEIQKYPYNTHDNLKKLINLLEEILRKWGKL